MFTTEQVIDAVKDVAKTMQVATSSYCKTLDVVSWQIGYESYHHLKTSLAKLPQDQHVTVSIKSMKLLCSLRLPSPESSYYEFIYHCGGKLDYESRWIGWDEDGKEVRHPAASFSCSILQEIRQKSKHLIYVLDSIDEVRAWMINMKWHGVALINGKIAQDIFEYIFNQQHRCVENPRLDNVEAEAMSHIDNYATTSAQEVLSYYWSKRKPY